MRSTHNRLELKLKIHSDEYSLEKTKFRIRCHWIQNRFYILISFRFRLEWASFIDWRGKPHQTELACKHTIETKQKCVDSDEDVSKNCLMFAKGFFVGVALRRHVSQFFHVFFVSFSLVKYLTLAHISVLCAIKLCDKIGCRSLNIMKLYGRFGLWQKCEQTTTNATSAQSMCTC